VSSSSNVDFERPSRSTLWASTFTSVLPWPDFAKTQNKAEQIQFIYFPEKVQLPYSPQLPHPPIPTHPQFIISGLQDERLIQSRSTPFSAFHSSLYSEQHISVCEPRLTVPELPNTSGPSLSRPEPPPSSMALQQQPSEHMDVDHPRQLIPEPAQAQGQQVSLAFDLFPPAYTVTQDQFSLRQFSDAQQSQCSNYAPGSSSPHRSFPYSPPMVEHISAAPAASDQEGHALPSIPPVLTTSVSQSHWHVNQPLQDRNVTEPPAFDVLPETATTYVDLSLFHPAATPPPYSEYSESTYARGMLSDMSTAWHAATAEYAPPQPLVQNIPPTVTPPARTSSPRQQPESIRRPPSPADSVRAIGEITTSIVSPDTTDARADSWRRRQ